MHVMFQPLRNLRSALALLGAFALFGSSAVANTTPYDGTGVIVQGPSCLLYQDDFTGQLYANGDANGYGVFGLGDHVHIIGDQYPCVVQPCTIHACVGFISLIEPYGASIDPSVPFCFGDTASVGCPCANPSVLGAGEGCRNSTGVGARLAAVGTDLVADDILVLEVTQARASQTGVLIQGRTQIEVPFRDGLLCMGNPTERLELMSTDAAGAVNSSVSLVTEGAITPGDTVHYQFWFRDPVVSVCGSGSNLTNALTVTWQ